MFYKRKNWGDALGFSCALAVYKPPPQQKLALEPNERNDPCADHARAWAAAAVDITVPNTISNSTGTVITSADNASTIASWTSLENTIAGRQPGRQ
jgi:hypothetical protein